MIAWWRQRWLYRKGRSSSRLTRVRRTRRPCLLTHRRIPVVSSGAKPVDIAYPAPGWVEQDADAVWASVLGAVAKCHAAVPHLPIAAISISNQRESVAIWDAATGAALGPVLGWQDARTSSACAALSAHAPQVARLTGLGLDAMFSAPKMRWLLDRNDSSRAARWGTIRHLPRQQVDRRVPGGGGQRLSHHAVRS